MKMTKNKIKNIATDTQIKTICASVAKKIKLRNEND